MENEEEQKVEAQTEVDARKELTEKILTRTRPSCCHRGTFPRGEIYRTSIVEPEYSIEADPITAGHMEDLSTAVSCGAPPNLLTLNLSNYDLSNFDFVTRRSLQWRPQR